jgi:ParB-like chromosome segregation protein Spo0J
MSRRAPSHVHIGFEAEGVRLSISDITPLRLVTDTIRLTPKYRQIVTSIREVGVIEPPIVSRDKGDCGRYLLLDGHLRIEALKELGEVEVVCLVSTDDEDFTYNKRVNRIAIIQEHRMILKAIERGASEERIAKALNVDVAHIARKRRLLDGICSEVADLLKDKHISINTFWQLKKLGSLRQLEAAELMVAMNKYTTSYAKSLVAATPQAQLARPDKPKKIRGLSGDQVTLIERESANLEQEFRIAEQAYGVNHLDLVLTKGYLRKLLSNPRVALYLEKNHDCIFTEFRKMANVDGHDAEGLRP